MVNARILPILLAPLLLVPLIPVAAAGSQVQCQDVPDGRACVRSASYSEGDAACTGAKKYTGKYQDARVSLRQGSTDRSLWVRDACYADRWSGTTTVQSSIYADYDESDRASGDYRRIYLGWWGNEYDGSRGSGSYTSLYGGAYDYDGETGAERLLFVGWYGYRYDGGGSFCDFAAFSRNVPGLADGWTRPTGCPGKRAPPAPPGIVPVLP